MEAPEYKVFVPAGAVRSGNIWGTGAPLSDKSVFVALPKQTIETRTAAPSTTQGSSAQAQNIPESCAIASRTLLLLLCRIELVATRPTRSTERSLMWMRALANQ